MVTPLAETVKKLRSQAGYSQRGLAELLGCDYTYISKIENDKTDYTPSEEVLRTLARIFGVGEEYLIFLSGRIPSAYAGLLSELALKHGEKLPGKLKKLL